MWIKDKYDSDNREINLSAVVQIRTMEHENEWWLLFDYDLGMNTPHKWVFQTHK